ncbi:hypothetical protein A7D16_17040 [Xanthomonas nasturtii]|uniref:DUF2934 domain-containing protein n=1 Tax=Xanthomonas nasturtii TaxID=1843581 RepID=A0A3E1KJZ1_9XANT|nr:DUF2934 domain-containing protein [Xanthomonas nasturtii]MCL1499205.1 DUF2934 domain-containing protein [Xanthomonas nasturtii]MCL1502940.1 DUF2934 domain-containing protein [Xanthomonas nasturtii]MCL1523036.1 DUF2934 domain-containing protein [Xanthomonas nasturtii]MCL1527672.1 DUF2934 domain-containing protein [Xanthomonas nasturtii]MCL1529065.1 DUF2934 domain-containing protein [Xanthomonas nasturtii]
MNDMERQARLAQLAQEIWEAEGRPDGHADRHWAMAERLVDAEERAAEQAAEHTVTPITARQ